MNSLRLRNLTTKKLHTDILHFYEDLEWIIGEKGLMTHMIPNMLIAVEPWLKEHVTDQHYWNGQYDPSHIEEYDLIEPTNEEREIMFNRYEELNNPLSGKKVIEILI